MNTKNLFFGFETLAPWPHKYPSGRILDESERHITIAFLGHVPQEKILSLLPDIPTPPFKIGPAGVCDQCLFLPPSSPHVVAWHIDWIDTKNILKSYHNTLTTWLRQHEFTIDSREFLPHVTLCRSPFSTKDWKKAFQPLPCFITNLNLYESIGNLKYASLWKHPIKKPFEEIEHTADIAYLIHGESLQQLFIHAQIALAFRFPQLLVFFKDIPIGTLEQTVVELNEIIYKADADVGCPFKAVSFHGSIVEQPDATLTWEMIVDV